MSSHGTDPEDVDATFAAIVADLRAEGVGEFAGFVDEAAEPRTDKFDKVEKADGTDKSGPAEPEPAEPSWRAGGLTWDDTMFGDAADPTSDEEEHYIPPEPPPLPKPGKGAFIVLLFFLVGLFLLIAPGLIGISASLGTPLGILSLATAIALLLLRVKQGPPDGADPSNGAQV